MSDLRFQIWSLLKLGPDSAANLSVKLHIDKSRCCNLMRRMRESGYITYSHCIGRDSFYKVTDAVLDKNKPQNVRRTLPPGAARPKKKRYASIPGFGSGGKIALEEVWPITTKSY